MINCEFKKNYLSLILGILFFICLIVLAVFLSVKDAFGVLTGACLGAIAGAAGYLIARFFALKKQYLKITNDSFSANVITVKNGKLMKIDKPLSFIVSAHCKDGILVLVNERNEKLTIYNIKDVKKVVDDINNLVNYQPNTKEE